MDEQLMSGMFWAGVLLSSIPILLGLGVGAFVLRRYLVERGLQRDSGAERPRPASTGRAP